MQVGEFLSRYPVFTFDVIEHLEATRYADALLARLQRARTWAAECSAPVPWPNNGCPSALGAFGDMYAGRFDSMTTKDDLRNRLGNFIDITSFHGPVWGKRTSGTTGPPILIPYSAEFYFDQLYLPLIRAAIFHSADVSRHNVFALNLTDNRSCVQFVLSDPTETVGLILQVVLRDSTKTSVDVVWELLGRLQPSVLSLKPVILECLLRCTPNPPDVGFLRFIFCSGSVLSDELRNEAELAFGRPIVNGYGLTEFGIMGFECANRSLHYDPAVFHVEAVANGGDRALEGTPGVIAVTTDTNALLPLSRYYTEDVAALVTTGCACGRAGPRLTNLAGRVQSCFRGRQGELLSPIRFISLFDDVRIAEYQITQEAPGSLVVLIEPLAANTSSDVLRRARLRIHDVVPGTWNVEIRLAQLRERADFQRHQINLASMPNEASSGAERCVRVAPAPSRPDATPPGGPLARCNPRKGAS